jgi:hypothetical protein
MAAEDAFQQVVAAMGAAGWEEDEIAIAIMELAINHRLALAANCDTEAAIVTARLKS